MKNQQDAIAEHKYKIVDSYIEWEKAKLLESVSVIIPRTCLENVIKAEIIRNYNIFGITEFNKDTRKLMVMATLLRYPDVTTFSFQDCLFLIAGANLISDPALNAYIKDIQLPGNTYAHNPDMITKAEAEEIDVKLQEILNWFFKNIGVPDWKQKLVEPRLSMMYDTIAEKIAEKLDPQLSNNSKKDEYPSIEFVPFDKSKESYNILILPFPNREKDDEISPIGKNLRDMLKEKSRIEKLPIDVQYFPNAKSEDAEDIGKALNADIVIWGNDSFRDHYDEHKIHFSYLAIESNELHYGIVKHVTTDRLIRIYTGQISLEIENMIYFFMGGRYMKREDNSRALECFANIKTADSGVINYLRGLCYTSIGKYDQAKESFEEALVCEPDYIEALFSYAMLFKKHFNDPENAVKYFKRIITIDPVGLKERNIEFVLAFTHNNYGEILANVFGDNLLAKEHFFNAIRICPNNAELNYNYAALLDTKLNENNEAIVYYNKALEIDPHHFNALQGYAILLGFKLKENRKANKLFRKALKVNGVCKDLHSNFAIFLAKCNDLTGAENHYRRAIEIDDGFATGHYNFGLFLYQEKKDMNLSLVHLDKAIEADPKYARAYYHKAVVFAHLRDETSSKECLKQAMKLDPWLDNFIKSNPINSMLKD